MSGWDGRYASGSRALVSVSRLLAQWSRSARADVRPFPCSRAHMPLTPEQQARVEIDGQLTEAGWVVQDYGAINIHAADGVAVREFPLKWTEDGQPKGGFVDYLLYAHGQVIGVVEPKPASILNPTSHSRNFRHIIPSWQVGFMPVAFRRIRATVSDLGGWRAGAAKRLTG